MATEYNINSQWTLLERAKVCGPEGRRVLPVLDVMDKLGVKDFLKDVPYFPCSHGLKHRFTRTAGRTSPTRRKFYQGVERSHAPTQVLWNDVVLFEERSEIDEDHVDTVENGDLLRGEEDREKAAAILEGEVDAFFNDRITSGGEYIEGFKGRMNIISHPGNATNTTLPYCWDNGGTSTLSSIYCIDWGKKAAHGLFPSVTGGKMGTLGLDVRNKGKEKATDAEDSLAIYYVYVTQLKKWVGLVMNDDRRWFRVANVNSTYGGSNGFDETVLIRALNHSRINKSTARLYVNPYIKSQIDIRAELKGNVNLTMQNVFGEPVMTFLGIPIRTLDETILTASETKITTSA